LLRQHNRIGRADPRLATTVGSPQSSVIALFVNIKADPNWGFFIDAYKIQQMVTTQAFLCHSLLPPFGFCAQNNPRLGELTAGLHIILISWRSASGSYYRQASL
jgi:hypothetical protein